MAKRKNPLKDLDSFLKQEAASIVTPAKVDATPRSPQDEPSQPIETAVSESPENMTTDDVIVYLEGLHHADPSHFKTTLHHIIRKSLENTGLKDASDKMLMNTLLYLDNPQDWKKTIEQYWKTK